ncbi:winged helix-turn-helix domain-containing protein [Eisenbergiella sp.]
MKLELLYFLFCHKGQVFTKEQLYDNVWGVGYKFNEEKP